MQEVDKVYTPLDSALGTASLSSSSMMDGGMPSTSPGCNSVFQPGNAAPASTFSRERMPSTSSSALADFGATIQMQDRYLRQGEPRTATHFSHLHQPQQRQQQRPAQHYSQPPHHQHYQPRYSHTFGATPMPEQYNLNGVSAAQLLESIEQLDGRCNAPAYSQAYSGSNMPTAENTQQLIAQLGGGAAAAPAPLPQGSSQARHHDFVSMVQATAAPGAYADFGSHHTGAGAPDMGGVMHSDFANTDFATFSSAGDLSQLGSCASDSAPKAVHTPLRPQASSGRKPRRDTRKRRKRKRLTETKKRELRNEHLRELNIQHAKLKARSLQAREQIHRLLDQLVGVSKRKPELSALCQQVAAH